MARRNLEAEAIEELKRSLSANDPDAITEGIALQTDRMRTAQARFLWKWGETCDAVKAAEYAGIGTPTVVKWGKDDPQFGELAEQVRTIIALRLEAEATRRALEGVEYGVWYQGERVGTERKYSDQLLTLLLKAHAPERYGDKPDTEQVVDATITKLRQRQHAVLQSEEARNALYAVARALNTGGYVADTHTNAIPADVVATTDDMVDMAEEGPNGVGLGARAHADTPTDAQNPTADMQCIEGDM